MDICKEKLNEFIDYIKTKKVLFSIALIIISIPLILLIITKMTPSSRNIREINKLAKEVSSINATLENSNDSDNVNSETAKNDLSIAIVNLNKVKVSLDALEVSETVTETKIKFNETLDYNIAFCEQALSMYMSQSSPNLDNKLKDYKGALDSFKESNNSLTKLRIESLMSEDSLELFDKTYKYFDTLIQINIMKDITKEKNSSYMLSTDKLISKFKEIDDDLKPALEDIKENKRDLSVLLTDITNKKSIFENIKNDFYTLSVPEEATELHSSLLQSINTYESYINLIDNTLDSDIDSKDNPKNLDEYEDSFSKYIEFIDSLNKSCKDFESFKEK